MTVDQAIPFPALLNSVVFDNVVAPSTMTVSWLDDGDYESRITVYFEDDAVDRYVRLELEGFAHGDPLRMIFVGREARCLAQATAYILAVADYLGYPIPAAEEAE